jgi:hypothetical protein
MKTNNFIIITFSVLCLILYSCNSVKTANTGEPTRSKSASTLNLKDFPSLAFSATNGNIISYFDDAVVDHPLSPEGQAIFNDNIVYNGSAAYNLFDEENTVNFYIMIFDFIKTVENPGNIKKGDIVGKAAKTEPKLLIFCSSIDPYLLLCSRKIPFYYDGYYWFEGGFLFPDGGTNWFNYEFTDDIEVPLTNIADQVMAEPPALTFYPNIRHSFITQLKAYPRSITNIEKQRVATFENMFYRNNNTITHVTEFYAGDYKYYLCWPKGVTQNMERRYDLNEDIWIYGSLVTYSVWNECGYFFIRDYLPLSLEDEYEKRLRQIKDH